MKQIAKQVFHRGMRHAKRAKQCVASMLRPKVSRSEVIDGQQSTETSEVDTWASNLFDADYYRTHHADVAQLGIDPLNHYLTYGRFEQRRAHPLFDPAFYLSAYSDVRDAGVAAINHYLTDGAKEGRLPHPLFDSRFYLKKYADVAAGGMNPVVHYVCHGASEDRWPHPLFDPAYYRSQFAEDLGDTFVIEHYRTSITHLVKSPHRLFDTSYYLSQSGPIPAEVTPLEHYLHTGLSLGHSPHPLFDSAYYLGSNPDVASSGVNPLVHYVLYGSAEDRSPHPLFSPQHYRQQSNFFSNDITILEHFIQTRNQYSPHPLFSPSYYLSQLDPGIRHNTFAFQDYCVSGVHRSIIPHPLFRSLAMFGCAPAHCTVASTIRGFIQAVIDRHKVPCPIPADSWSNQLVRQIGTISGRHSSSQSSSNLAAQQQYAHECSVALQWIRLNEQR